MTQYLSAEEARDKGVLLELNRQLLHPRGLALETQVAKDGSPAGYLAISELGLAKLKELATAVRTQGLMPEKWCDDLDTLLRGAVLGVGVFRIEDHRDDPEGVIFAPAIAEREARAAAFAEAISPKREEALGFIIQPL